MADLALRLYGPAQLTTTATTLYTVANDRQAILRYIRFIASPGADKTVTLSIGTDAPATQFIRAMTVIISGIEVY